MGNALIFGGDAPACVAWLRNAHRHYPDDAQIAFDLFFHLSNLPGADWVDVLRFAEAGLAARPSPGMYLWLASALMRLGRVDEAVACYETVFERYPNDVTAHSALSQVHACKGQWKEAAASLARAIELDPKAHWSSVQLGFVLAELGDLPVFQKYCETMLATFAATRSPGPATNCGSSTRASLVFVLSPLTLASFPAGGHRLLPRSRPTTAAI